MTEFERLTERGKLVEVHGTKAAEATPGQLIYMLGVLDEAIEARDLGYLSAQQATS